MKQPLLSTLLSCMLMLYSTTLVAQTSPAKQWDKTFGGAGKDAANGVSITSGNGFMIGGESDSPIGGDRSQNTRGGRDFWLVQTDLNGNKIWDKTFGGNGEDYINDIRRTADGGYILGGTSSSDMGADKGEPNRGSTDYWAVKIDANGNKTWDETYGSTHVDVLLTMQQTTDGGYIAGGHSHGNMDGDKSQTSRGFSDYWIVKTDANGIKQWNKSFGGDSFDQFASMIQTADGGYLLGGYSSSTAVNEKSQPSKGGEDFWVIKLDNNGNKLWDKTLGGAQSEMLSDLFQTPDGGYLLGGMSKSGISGDKTQANKGLYDIWVVKLDAAGNKLWDRSFGGTGSDELKALYMTATGECVIAAASDSGISGDKSQGGNGGSDFWILRLNSNGNKIWEKTFGGTDTDIPHAILQTPDRGYVITGTTLSGIGGDKSQPSRGFWDYWVLKLSPDLLGTEEAIQANFNLYPNPATGILNIEFKGQKNAQVKVYNALGQCIFKKAILKNVEQPFQIDLSKEAKGVYTVQIITSKQSITRKVVLE